MGIDPLRRPADEHLEIEVKLHVPDDSCDGVDAAVREAGTAHDVHLVAQYHDTVDWALAARGLTWRIRREGDRWVQTLKGRTGDDAMARVEHDVDVTHLVAADGSPPALDASLHDGPLGHRLCAALDAIDGGIGALHARFATDVHRVECLASNEHGTVLLALDRGRITAGEAWIGVSELEIELVEGSADAVLVEADSWATRFGLQRDPVNKARRGRALADARCRDEAITSRSPDDVGTAPDDR